MCIPGCLTFANAVVFGTAAELCYFSVDGPHPPALGGLGLEALGLHSDFAPLAQPSPLCAVVRLRAHVLASGPLCPPGLLRLLPRPVVFQPVLLSCRCRRFSAALLPGSEMVRFPCLWML